MDYEKLKEIAKTISKEDFIKEYKNPCPLSLGEMQCKITYCPLYKEHCWFNLIEDLYNDIDKERKENEANIYTAEKLIYAIKTHQLKDTDKIKYYDNIILDVKVTQTIKDVLNKNIDFLLMHEPYILIKSKNKKKQNLLELTQKYFIENTEIKEGMKLRIQNEDPYENKFEHICTVKKRWNKLYLKDDNSEAEFSIDDCSIKILEIIRE